MMFELAINSAIALMNALMSLLTVASIATVISEADAVSLLVGTANGRHIAVLRLLATESLHFESIAGWSASVEIKTLAYFIDFLCGFVGGDMPLTIRAAADEGGNVILSLGAANIGNTPYTSFDMVLGEALDHHKIFSNQQRIYTTRVGIATTRFTGMVVRMAESFVHKVTMTITDANVVFGGFDQEDIILDHNSCVIAGDLGNVPMKFVIFVVDLFSIIKGKGIYNSDMIWINGSHFGPPMLNFTVPSIGELSFFFV